MSEPKSSRGTASEASGLTLEELRAYLEMKRNFALRDLFAAFALAGLVMRRPLPDGGDAYPYSYDAQDAYEAADFMLAEREKKA